MFKCVLFGWFIVLLFSLLFSLFLIYCLFYCFQIWHSDWYIENKLIFYIWVVAMGSTCRTLRLAPRTKLNSGWNPQLISVSPLPSHPQTELYWLKSISGEHWYRFSEGLHTSKHFSPNFYSKTFKKKPHWTHFDSYFFDSYWISYEFLKLKLRGSLKLSPF